MAISRSSFLIVLLTFSAYGQSSPEMSFEKSFNTLQRKIEILKQKGERINDQSRKEIDELLAQMNHQHTQLKHEIDRKNSELNEKLSQAKKREEEWSGRAYGAYAEIKSGLMKAWAKLTEEKQ